MTFRRKLEFYSLETEGVDFCEVLKDIYKKKNKNSKKGGRIIEANGFAMSMIRFKNGSDYCEGIVARCNRDDLPMKGNFYTQFFDFIKLKKNDGLIDMTYFCYIKDLKILCLLPARKGVKWATFRFYIQGVHALKDKFNLYPLLNKKAMDKFRKMGSITSVNADIDIGNNSYPSSGVIEDSTLNSLLENAKNAHASRIKVELYNKKKEKGLLLRPIKTFIKSLVDLGVLYKAHSIRVRGSSNYEEADEIIDLIKQRYMLPIILGENSRSLIFKECRKAVHKKIEGKKIEIGELVE